MKKGICLFLSGILLLTLTACGGRNNAPTAEEEPPSSTESSVSAGVNVPAVPAEEPFLEEEGEDPVAPGADSTAEESQSAAETGGNAAGENQISGEALPAGESHAPVEESAPPEAVTNNTAEKTDIPAPVEDNPKSEKSEEEAMDSHTFYVSVGDTVFAATFAENVGAQALQEMLADGPVTISMSDYGGFEKVGALGQSLPTSNSQTTTQAGDIVLYQGNQIVIFYGSNSWSYTRLGKINDLSGWADALGSGNVSVTFSLTA